MSGAAPFDRVRLARDGRHARVRPPSPATTEHRRRIGGSDAATTHTALTPPSPVSAGVAHRRICDVPSTSAQSRSVPHGGGGEGADDRNQGGHLKSDNPEEPAVDSLEAPCRSIEPPAMASNGLAALHPVSEIADSFVQPVDAACVFLQALMLDRGVVPQRQDRIARVSHRLLLRPPIRSLWRATPSRRFRRYDYACSVVPVSAPGALATNAGEKRGLGRHVSIHNAASPRYTKQEACQRCALADPQAVQ